MQSRPLHLDNGRGQPIINRDLDGVTTNVGDYQYRILPKLITALA
jgi:hypothetical protein